VEREKVVVALAAELDTDLAAARRICTVFARVIDEGLRTRGRFGLRGLGSFERKKHPYGSEVIFRASSGLRRRVQAGSAARSEQRRKQAANTTASAPGSPVLKPNMSGTPFNVPAGSEVPAGAPAPGGQESGAKRVVASDDAPAAVTISQDIERCEIPAASGDTMLLPKSAEVLQQVLAAENGREAPVTITPEPGPKRLNVELKPLPIGVRPPLLSGQSMDAADASSAPAEAIPADFPRPPGTGMAIAAREEEKGGGALEQEQEDEEITRLVKELGETGATPEQVRLLEGHAGSKLRLLKCLRCIHRTTYGFTTFDLLACCVSDWCRDPHSPFGRTETT
jgi:hypothetical protein